VILNNLELRATQSQSQATQRLRGRRVEIHGGSKSRLTAAVGEFENEVAEGSGAKGEVNRLVRQYLSPPGDRWLPVSLEYLFVTSHSQGYELAKKLAPIRRIISVD
jgi:hypothetical protein